MGTHTTNFKRHMRSIALFLCAGLTLLWPASAAHAEDWYTVSGTMRDANSQPLAGVQLEIIGQTDGSSSASVTTDQNGGYSAQVTPGDYMVILTTLQTPNAYTPTQANLTTSGTAFTVSSHDVSQDVGFTGVPVTVTVKDASGNAVPNATAELRATGNGSTTLLAGNSAGYTTVNGSVDSTATTGSDGSATMLALTGLEYQACAYTAVQVQICAPATISPTAATSAEVDLPVLHTVSGTLRDGDGSPLAGWRLGLISTDSQHTSTATYTDVNGHYEAALEAGYYTITSDNNTVSTVQAAPRFTSLTNGDQAVNLTNGDATQDLQLATAHVAVTVTDGNGTPVENAAVQLRATGEGSTLFLLGNPAAFTTVADGANDWSNSDDTGVGTTTGLVGLTYRACAAVGETQVCGDPFTLAGDTTASVTLP